MNANSAIIPSVQNALKIGGIKIPQIQKNSVSLNAKNVCFCISKATFKKVKRSNTYKALLDAL